MEVQPNLNFRLSKPFRFQSSWLADDSFPNLVRDAWSNNPGLYDAIKKFTTKAAKWNRVHFGNVFAKKRRVLARLSGIQRVMADGPSGFLINLEKQLQIDLSNILNQEEELWALKSRINWMIQGDRNTPSIMCLHSLEESTRRFSISKIPKESG